MAAVKRYETVVTSTSAFRGNWQVTLEKPERFGKAKYLPTPPPPPEPVREPESCTAEDPGPAEKENSSFVAPPAPAWNVGERMHGPPSGVPVWLTISDRDREYRSCITKEGTVINNVGQIMGYVNVASREVGSASEQFLGCVLSNKWDNVYQIRGHKDQLIGYIDMGTASVKDAMGATVVDLEHGGVVKHPNGTYLGQFKGIDGFHDMEIIALYLGILDIGMTGDVSG